MRKFIVIAAVLVVGLVAGYTVGRFPAGRYAVYCSSFRAKSDSVAGDGLIVELCRYDTFTGRTWISFPSQTSAKALWREVAESNEFTVTKEAAAEADRKAANTAK